MQEETNINKNIILSGKKIQMAQVFSSDGKVIPVTVIGITEEFDMTLLGKQVTLVGTSKGKGFAGVMKKWNFAGGQATRGQSDKARAAGSIGAQTPGRVYKGKKMAGRMGNKKITLKKLKLVNVDPIAKRVYVSGPVPGARNSKVLIKVL